MGQGDCSDVCDRCVESKQVLLEHTALKMALGAELGTCSTDDQDLLEEVMKLVKQNDEYAAYLKEKRRAGTTKSSPLANSALWGVLAALYILIWIECLK